MLWWRIRYKKAEKDYFNFFVFLYIFYFPLFLMKHFQLFYKFIGYKADNTIILNIELLERYCILFLKSI